MKVLFMMSLFLLLSSCAARKLVVDNADTLLSHQITKRLPLYSDQKKNLGKDLDKYLEKSKSKAQELLPVIDKVKSAEAEVIEAEYGKLESFYRDVSTSFSGLISKYLSQLDKKQQKELFENLDDENREMLKKEKEDRIDDTEEKFEMLLGTVTGEQKQLIREYGDYYQSRAQTRLDNRIKLHEKFREIFKHDSSQESKVSEFQEAFDSHLTASLKNNKTLEIIKKVVPTLKESQKEHFRKKADEAKDLVKYYMTVEY